MNHIVKRYLKDVYVAFPVHRATEKRFYEEFRDTVLEYSSSIPSVTLNDLSARFGDPKQVVMDYFNAMDSGIYINAMRHARYLKISVCSLVIFLTASLCLYSLNLWSERKEWENTIVTHEQTVVTYNEWGKFE